jgi:hypothetical protein
MRLFHIAVICLTLGILCGCEETMTDGESRNLDVELVKTINNIAVENAIITQHTLYPYHFVADGEQLNELGQRDFGVLAQHFKEHPGVMNIRQGEAGAELYEARVAQVLSGLKQAGVETSRMSISDAMPGGSGMSSEQVITILAEEPQSSRTGGTAGTTFTR